MIILPMKNRIIPYNSELKEYARYLRNNSTLSEVLLWNKIKKKALGVEFHRQVPLNNFIVDFYCTELQLAIEVDGTSHNHMYQYDCKRQNILEKQGVVFLRIDDIDVKTNINGVLIAVQNTIDKIKGESS